VDSTEGDLRKALREADWEKMLPNLLAYAARRLRRMGWVNGRDEEPGPMSVEQLVNTAIEHCLDGTRTWDSTSVDLAGFLRGIIRSLASSERKKHVRAKTFAKDDLEPYVAPADSIEDEAVAEEGRREILGAVEECVNDDADLSALYLAILDGHMKREDIAEALGWDVDRVTAARIKLQRRLVRTAPEMFAATRDKRRRVS